MLDLNVFDDAHQQALSELDGNARVAMACWAAAYNLPVYKRFRDTHDWKTVDPVIDAGWTYIAKGKVALPRKLWDRAGELSTHYYFEGKPLLLFAVATATNLLRTIDRADDQEYASRTAARVLTSVVRLGAEVDAVLRQRSAEPEARAWIDERLEHLKTRAPRREDAAIEPHRWMPALEAHPDPVRKQKLD